MEIAIIIGLVLFLLAAFLALKFIKNVIVAVGAIFLCLIFLIGGIGAFTYTEAMDIKENALISPNQILIVDGAFLLSGATVLPGEEFSLTESVVPIDDNSLDTMATYYSNNELDDALDVVKLSDYYTPEEVEMYNYHDDVYKAIIIDVSLIENYSGDVIDFSNLFSDDDPSTDVFLKITGDIKKAEVLTILRSEDPWTEFQTIIEAKLSENIEPEDVADTAFADALPEEIQSDTIDEIAVGIITENSDDIAQSITETVRGILTSSLGHDDLKLALFLLSLSSISQDEDGLAYVFESYKDEDIQVYPSSIIFDLIRFAPGSLVDRVQTEMKNAVKEASAKIKEE